MFFFCKFLYSCRKLSSLRKSPKKSPRKTPSKSPFKIKKGTPSSSAKKKLAMRFRQMSGEFENILPSSSQQSGRGFKRALFSSEKESGELIKFLRYCDVTFENSYIISSKKLSLLRTLLK